MSASDEIPDREIVLHAISQVIDPEIGLDIVSIGLVEKLEVGPGAIEVGLIMTTPACPQGAFLCGQAEDSIKAAFPGVKRLEVTLLDSPFWTPARMSDAARAKLGWPG